MNASNESPSQPGAEEDLTGSKLGKGNRIIKRFGGRHLIFRTKTGGWWMIPKPYVLVSSFRGIVWVFYGIGQIWATHKKEGQIEDWIIRKPRFISKTVSNILDKIRPQLVDFIEFCNSQSIEGTIVIERKMIEFHWTFGNEPLPKEKQKPENSETLDSNFNDLVEAFLKAKKDLGI
jgi:hypothetical protein